MSQQPPKRALVALPAWMWGGNPTKYLDAADLRSRGVSNGALSVQTSESYLHRAPSLVELHPIVVPGGPAPRWEQLSSFSERVELELPPGLGEELLRRQQRAEQSGEVVDLLNLARLILLEAPIPDLADRLKSFLDALHEVSFSDGGQGSPFTHAGIHVVSTHPALLHRLKLASVLLRMEQDPELASIDPRQRLRMMNQSRGEAFSSSADLYSGVLTIDPYLDPLLAAGTPGVWAVSVPRTFGVMVLSLGTFIAGASGDAAELLQLITTPSAVRATEFPRLTPAAGNSALAWWTGQLNTMFGVLSDLAVFTDKHGTYRPAKHLQAVLTVEQIFRRTTSMLVAHRDTHARRALLFTILDSLEGVRGANLRKMFELRHAQGVLADLQSSIPEPAAQILLPAAQRAVTALEEAQQGFFLHHQLASTTVDLRTPERTISLTPEAATADYLKVLRDATHGHGSNKEGRKARTAALLAHHNGVIPHDLGLLGYLYLLDTLAKPERLRCMLFRSRT